LQKVLKILPNVQGWKQFLTVRKEMLDAFDAAQTKANSQKVKAAHGLTAEAEFRKWLSDFLPKKYGVTSGYIVSQGLRSTDKTPHFDVIIYDRLESPVLWIQGTTDDSTQGRSLAIPAEHVVAVIEVKARFTTASVKSAMDHLGELSPLMGGVDHPAERYKLHLPHNFFCALVFFELVKKARYSISALKKIISGSVPLRGFFGGIILRGEGHGPPDTGRLQLAHCQTPVPDCFGKSKKSLLDSSAFDVSAKVAENFYVVAGLMWSESAFSQFAFDLVAICQGTYQPGRLSSFHGQGESEWEGKWG
jgi:hypothetical protein